MSAKIINRSKTTQLSDITNFDTSKIIFDEPFIGVIPDEDITYARINIGVKNKDKTEGDLVFALPKLSTFGIKEVLNKKTKLLDGYQAGILLFDGDEQSEEQLTVLKTINSVLERCKDHVIENKKKCKKPGLEKSDLKQMTPISLLKDKVTEDLMPTKPVLNTKLIYSKPKKDKNQNEIPSKVFTSIYKDDVVDSEGNPIKLELEDFLNKRGTIRAVIKIEGIFVGSQIKLQLKILEAAISTNEEQKVKKNRFLTFSNISREDDDEEYDMPPPKKNEEPEIVRKVDEDDDEESFTVPVQKVDDSLEMSEEDEPPKKAPVIVKKKKSTK